MTLVTDMNKTPPTSIKLLVIDIDGTLLNPEGKITERTLAAVQAAQQAGIIVTLATARRYSNTRQIANELGLESPIIVYDGVLIVDHPTARILHMDPFQADIAQQAVEVLVNHKLQPVVHPASVLNEEIWTGPLEFDNLWLETYFSVYPEQVRRMPFENLCIGHPDPLRVVTFDEEQRIYSLLPQLGGLDCSWIAIKRGSYGCAELSFMHRGCSKASGVVALAQLLDIPLEQVMALGDNNNDKEMLQVVGWGVAMGQASETIKAVAQAVTASNAEDGAAQAIERYTLRWPATIFSNSLKRATCL
jgi:hydroxymethylpyrimidine pyrophosphatase-like HAD family hydrolase